MNAIESFKSIVSSKLKAVLVDLRISLIQMIDVVDMIKSGKRLPSIKYISYMATYTMAKTAKTQDASHIKYENLSYLASY